MGCLKLKGYETPPFGGFVRTISPVSHPPGGCGLNSQPASDEKIKITVDILSTLLSLPGKNSPGDNFEKMMEEHLSKWKKGQGKLPEFRGVPVDRLIGKGWRKHFSIVTGTGFPKGPPGRKGTPSKPVAHLLDRPFQGSGCDRADNTAAIPTRPAPGLTNQRHHRLTIV